MRKRDVRNGMRSSMRSNRPSDMISLHNGTMRITRHVHACVEINHEDTRIIIDPGSFGTPDLSGASILITHGHPDHIDASVLTSDMEIYAPRSVAVRLPMEVHVVDHGKTFRIGDLRIEALGSQHSMITKAQPAVENIGYLIDGRILHPGDAFQPIKNVELALLPVNGPWVKMLDVESFLKKYPPKNFIGIHDGTVNERGLAINRKILRLLSETYGATFLDLAPGDSHELPEKTR